MFNCSKPVWWAPMNPNNPVRRIIPFFPKAGKNVPRKSSTTRCDLAVLVTAGYT